MNQYRYVRNNPVNQADPSGLQPPESVMDHRLRIGPKYQNTETALNSHLEQTDSELTQVEQDWLLHPLFLYFNQVRKNRSRLERRDTRLAATVGKFDELGRLRVGFIVERRELVAAPENAPWYVTHASDWTERRFVARGVFWIPAADNYSRESIEAQRRFADGSLTIKLDSAAIEIAEHSTEAIYDFTIDMASLGSLGVGGVGRLSREAILDRKVSADAIANAAFQTLAYQTLVRGERLVKLGSFRGEGLVTSASPIASPSETSLFLSVEESTNGLQYTIIINTAQSAPADALSRTLVGIGLAETETVSTLVTSGSERLAISGMRVVSSELENFVAPATTQQPLRLTHQPTTHTLSQIRHMRQPAKWQAGEQYGQELYGSAGQRHFPVTGTGGRFVDAPVDLPSGGVLAGEVKTFGQWRTVSGVPQRQTVPLSDHIRQQIQKDVWLRNNVPDYDPRWVFLDAPPSQELLDFLRQNRIVSVTHQ